MISKISYNIQSIKQNARHLAVTALVFAVLLFATSQTARAGIYVTYTAGSPGNVYEPNGFVAGASFGAGTRSISVNGPSISGNGNMNFYLQKAFYDVWILRWDGYRWYQVGPTQSSYGRVNASTYISQGIKFPNFSWNISQSGYYTVKFRVRWFSDYGDFLGMREYQPNSLNDFNVIGGYRYSGYPGYLYF